MKDKTQPSEAPVLDSNTASQMLDNILTACDTQPNTVPLSLLSSYSNYKKDRFLFQRIILILIIFIFCLLPLFFITPKFSINDVTSKVYQPSFEIKVDSFLPVERIEAKISDTLVPVYETGEKVYSIVPAQNGPLEVKVVLKNRQSSIKTVEVTTVDLTPPDVLSTKSDTDSIYIYIEDDLSGIDYKNITARDIDGIEVLPKSYNETEGYVIFPHQKTSLNLVIPDNAGNTLQLVMTPKK